MSKPSASPSPLTVAISPAPMAPPAGPLRTLHAPPLAASAASATPPDDCITTGSGDAKVRAAPTQSTQVPAEEGGEVGVEDGGRAALVFTELRQDLAGGGDVKARHRLPYGLGERPLVGGVEK